MRRNTHTGFRLAIDYLTFVMVCAFGVHLYLYGAGGQTDGTQTVQAISVTVAHDVRVMNERGLRKPGDGTLNGMENNFETWFTSYRGCSYQADKVASDLQVSFPAWQFRVVHSPLHTWLVATDGNHRLRIDPWTGTVSRLV